MTAPIPPVAAVREPRLWAIVGATGTGKSDLSLDLVERLSQQRIGAEIVNVDAMQFYRGMDIGTAKLPLADRRGIPHHLFDVREVTEEAAVAWYQPLARDVITDIHARGNDAILVGGSGLYVSSVIYDFRFPPRDQDRRARLEAELAERGVGPLLARLREIDSATAARIDVRNERRVIRALEVAEQGESNHGATLPERPELWHAHTRVLGTAVERQALVERLDRRVERMWQEGMLDEVAALRAAGLEEGTTAPRAIGYAQALAQLAGEKTEAEAIAETQALTRRYARRQVSWFKRYPDIEWASPMSEAGAIIDGWRPTT